MNPDLFLADLEAKPTFLRDMAADPWSAWPAHRRMLLFGMGSSRYAARVAAHRLRAAGHDAVADYASAPSYPPHRDTLVVAISATGTSREVLDALDRYRGVSPIMAVTNDPASPVTEGADRVVEMRAGVEAGGVACRTYAHTLALLLALDPPTVRKAADATAHLLDTRDEWLPATADLLDGPDGVYAVAPRERIGSADQSALMVREGPRRPATACETGDWSHVDVYLTKTRDYRALLFPGSRYDGPALDWLRERRATVVAVGTEVEGAARVIRYPYADEPDVALLTEVLVAELVAARWWAAADR